ncbi:MAG: tetratricopeptide repeat protein [Phycisphaerae bacterium]
MPERTRYTGPAPTAPRVRSEPPRWLPLLIVLAAVAAYANSLHGTFILDDHRTIENNPRIRDLSALGTVLSHRRPLLDLSLAVNYAFGGTDLVGYHLINLLIHTLAGLTLFGLVRRTTALASPGLPPRRAAGFALVVALLWVVHPLQTQSVTYVIQRSESLMGLFYLLTLYAVLRGATATRSGGVTDDADGRPPPGSRRRTVWYTAAVVSCVLGMGAKPVMVTAPLAVLLFDRTFLSRSVIATLRSRWPLYAGLALAWTIPWLTRVAPAVLKTTAKVATVGFSYKGITPLEYAATQPGVILHYLWLSVWPASLCLDYGWPVADSWSAIAPQAFAIALLLGLTVWALLRRRWTGFVGAWFFLILAPTSSVIPIKDPLFEHRMYLPLAAVVVLAVILGERVLKALATLGGLDTRTAERLATGVVVFMVLVLTLGTARRNLDYESEVVMWRDVVAKRPGNKRGQYNYGTKLFETERLQEAHDAFREALRLDPELVDARYNLGKVLAAMGRTDEAERVYRRVLRDHPNLVEARVNLGNLLTTRRRLDEAVAEYRHAIRVDPKFIRSYFNLATVLQLQGKADEAVEVLHRAVKIDPNVPRIWFLLGNVLRAQQRPREAVEAYRHTLRLQPDHARARGALDALRRTRD